MRGSNRLVLLSPEAEQDVLSIWIFGAVEWSPERADRHLRDIDNLFERLRDDPKLGHKRDELIAGLRSILVRPHLIFYTQTPQAIRIARVLHQRVDTTMHFRQGSSTRFP
jgi:toxin ParE1/3/4